MKKSILAFGALALLAVNANAAVIDFEDLNNNGTSGYTLYGDNFDSGGFNFASVDHAGDSAAMASWTVDFGTPPYTGSISPFANYFGDTALMTKIGGGTFSVVSIDLEDVFGSASGATIHFIGTLADTSTVTQDVVLTDGSSLTTYALTGMTNLVSLSWKDTSGSTVQFDNIATDAVPEPASLAVLGLGALAMVRKRRRSA